MARRPPSLTSSNYTNSTSQHKPGYIVHWATVGPVLAFFLIASTLLVLIIIVSTALYKRRRSRCSGTSIHSYHGGRILVQRTPSNQMNISYYENVLSDDNTTENPDMVTFTNNEEMEDGDKQHLVATYVNYGNVVKPTAMSSFLPSMPSYTEQYWKPGATLGEIYQQLRRFNQYNEVPRTAVKKECKLGEGEFGEVFKGEWVSPTKTLTVALKLLKSSASDEERLKLIQEAAIMGQFLHPNIVRLYGVVTLSEPATIIMEYIPGDNLHLHLLKMKEREYPPEVKVTLLRFCQEIAGAMEYLSKKGFIHRDLAARNILLTTDMKCKLADFGMSHDMDDDYYYKTKGGVIPIKWTAPEAILYRKYTTKSDVWSYGMVMYEIWSLGHKPFEDFSVEEIVRCLSSGYCHPPPPGCPRAVYTIMVRCWEPDHHKRISFTAVAQLLKTDQRVLFRQSEGVGKHTGYILGASLSEGKHVFRDLQQLYSE